MNFSTVLAGSPLDVEIGFGKHGRRTYRWVYENDLNYYEWMNGEGLWPSAIPKKNPKPIFQTSEVPPLQVGNYKWIGIRVIDNPKQ